MARQVDGASAARSGRERLLDAAIGYFAEHGVGDASLRQIGEGIGSSHRMLLYHFASRDGLLVEVVRAVEQRQRDALAGDLRASAGDPVAAARRMWKRLSGPALEANERLFFELYGRALGGDPGAAPLLDGIVDDWVEPLFQQLRAADPETALSREELRLGIAVIRGLLLDLLATGNRRATSKAFQLFLSRYEPAAEPELSGRSRP